MPVTAQHTEPVPVPAESAGPAGGGREGAAA